MKLREVSLAMQIKAMQRAAAPITVEYNIDTVADVKCFNRAVLDLLMQRKLGHHLFMHLPFPFVVVSRTSA